MRPGQPSFYLSDDGYDALVGEGNWTINEISSDVAVQVSAHFGIDTSFGVFASGVASPFSTETAGIHPVAGIDWVGIEDNPRPGEKPLNVYHYMIGQKQQLGYPVYHFGRKDTVAPHWSELEDLNVYVEGWK